MDGVTPKDFIIKYFHITFENTNKRWKCIPKYGVNSVSYSISWDHAETIEEALEILYKAILKSPEFQITPIDFIQVK